MRLEQPTGAVLPAGLGERLVIGEGRLVAAQQPTPAPAKSPAWKEQERVMPQGFSVVLVLADLTASGAQDDVPPAARRALADLKDFLPYKSYKLLDAAWLLGQGSMSVRLRGPDEQEYDLRLVASPYSSRAGQVSVQFSLKDTPDFAYDVAPLAAEAARLQAESQARGVETRKAQQEVAKLRSELRQAQEKRDEAAMRSLETKLRDLERELAGQRRVGVRATSPRLGRAIIDTSFTMDVGETVVVGTSRLKGNSRALIALLTAVPPRGASSRDETR